MFCFRNGGADSRNDFERRYLVADRGMEDALYPLLLQVLVKLMVVLNW